VSKLRYIFDVVDLLDWLFVGLREEVSFENKLIKITRIRRSLALVERLQEIDFQAENKSS
jgi:hypothetical protein